MKRDTSILTAIVAGMTAAALAWISFGYFGLRGAMVTAVFSFVGGAVLAVQANDSWERRNRWHLSMPLSAAAFCLGAGYLVGDSDNLLGPVWLFTAAALAAGVVISSPFPRRALSETKSQ